VEIGFEWRGASGLISVSVDINADPDALGCFPGASGLPVCTATVQFPQMGYRSMLGWVQLVRAEDFGSGSFENDPFALFGDALSPYCWYGLNPTLFDGPSRSNRDDDLHWQAHSFLATTPLEEVMALGPRRIIPLAGFSWGFEIADGDVTVTGPDELPLEHWNTHTETLRSTFPLWVFANFPHAPEE
jgi:hypothetical protein